MAKAETLVSDTKSSSDEERSPYEKLKPLPPSRYEFLGPNSNYPAFINASLSASQIDSLLRILRMHCKAIGYTLDDLEGIHPSVCMHRILMEDDHKSSIKLQSRLNPNMQEAVQKEILKLLQANIIYLVSDGKWVSLMHVVPKKEGMTIIKNENNEPIPTRIVTG